jgi:hypothetical protein
MRLRITGGTLLMASVFGLGSQGAAADDAGAASAGPISEVVITGQQPGDIAASGTKTDTPLIETPQSISIIDRQDLRFLGRLPLVDPAGRVEEQTGEHHEDATTYGPGARISRCISSWCLLHGASRSCGTRRGAGSDGSHCAARSVDRGRSIGHRRAPPAGCVGCRRDLGDHGCQAHQGRHRVGCNSRHLYRRSDPVSARWKIPPRFVAAALDSHSAIGLAFSALIYLVCLTGTLSELVDELKLVEQPSPAAAIGGNAKLDAGALNAAVTATLAHEPLATAIYAVAPTTSDQRLRLTAYGPDGESAFIADEHGLGAALTYVTASGFTIWLERQSERGRPRPRLRSAWRAWTCGVPAALAVAALASWVVPVSWTFWSLVVAAQGAALGRRSLRRAPAI